METEIEIGRCMHIGSHMVFKVLVGGPDFRRVDIAKRHYVSARGWR